MDAPKYLQSIEQVEPHQIIQTGCEPILVFCDNLEYYVCKYNTTGGSANMLFREFVAASFLKIWGLQVPDFALVNLQNQHNPESKGNINNQMPCFGSLHNNEYREVDAFVGEMSNTQRAKFADKIDLLKIALFDYWVSNEDRSFNNYNLLLHLTENKYQILPIDNGSVFHTGNQDKQNYTLSEAETLLTSPFLFSLFKNTDSIDNETIIALEDYYYFCTERCKLALQEILTHIPPQWLIDKQKEYDNLVQFLFQDSWLKECWQTFITQL